ncbi:MAG: dipeptidase, partial [Rhodothermales bacterium]|nr:dipeptidase [Rhodothermales bacterium]
MPRFQSPSLDAARSLAAETLIVDGHIDLPYWMAEVYREDISRPTIGGDFDYPRAREGCLDAAFMAIYVPVRFQESGGAFDYANHLIDMVDGFCSEHPDLFASAVRPADILINSEKSLVSLPMGIENGVAIEGKLEHLEHFHRRGVRYMTLVHAADNDICDSSFDTKATWGGLSEFGADVVREMERLGIMIDMSHVSDDAFFDILEVTSTPMLATHSSARHFTPGWQRNMSDDLIKALAERHGVMMINFGSDFLDGSYDALTSRNRKRINRKLERAGVTRFSEEGFRMLSEFRTANPVGDVADVVQHVRYVTELVGIDHVGLGSDFDGVFALPAGLQDVSHYPNLIAALMDDGFTSSEIRKVCNENVLRVWQEIED